MLAGPEDSGRYISCHEESKRPGIVTVSDARQHASNWDNTSVAGDTRRVTEAELLHQEISEPELSKPGSSIASNRRTSRSTSNENSAMNYCLPALQSRHPSATSQVPRFIGAFQPGRDSSAQDCLAPPADTTFKQQDEKRLISLLNTFAFDAFSLSTCDLVRSANIMLAHAFKEAEVGCNIVSPDALASFVNTCRVAYFDNPYHNFRHAVDVMQAVYSFLCIIDVFAPMDQPVTATKPLSSNTVLSKSDGLALMIASIGHDLGHPGLSNVFMIRAKTPLALIYNEQSPLENYHAFSLMQIMVQTGLGALLDNDVLPNMKKFLLGSILATDMSIHFDYIAKAEALTAQIKEPVDGTTLTPTDRSAVMALLLKCADVSNTLRPFETSVAWSEALYAEWSIQAELEADLKIPTSITCTEESRIPSQLNFMDLFVQPLYKMTCAIPGLLAIEKLAAQSHENRRKWSDKGSRRQSSPRTLNGECKHKQAPTVQAVSTSDADAQRHSANGRPVYGDSNETQDAQLHTASQQTDANGLVPTSLTKEPALLEQKPLLKSRSRLNLRINPQRWRLGMKKQRDEDVPAAR